MTKYIVMPEIKKDMSDLHKQFPDYMKSWEIIQGTDDCLSARFENGRTTIMIKPKTTIQEWDHFFQSLQRSAQVRDRHQRLKGEIATHLNDCKDERREILELWDKSLQNVIDWSDER